MGGCGCTGTNRVPGRFKMRFIGWKPDGTLMKGSPGGYVQDKIYEVPFHYSQWPYWKLIEPPPADLKVPDASKEDSVFSEVSVVPKAQKKDSGLEEDVVDDEIPPEILRELKEMGDGEVGVMPKTEIPKKRGRKPRVLEPSSPA